MQICVYSLPLIMMYVIIIFYESLYNSIANFLIKIMKMLISIERGFEPTYMKFWHAGFFLVIMKRLNFKTNRF